MSLTKKKKEQGLYCADFEHDACGIGFTANIKGVRTHQAIQDGLTILSRLVHRGAAAEDGTGDGAGMMLEIPHALFLAEMQHLHVSLPKRGAYGVGMFFLPMEAKARANAMRLITQCCKKRTHVDILGWREVPVMAKGLPERVEYARPYITQLFVQVRKNGALKHALLTGDALERELYVLRKIIAHTARAEGFAKEQLYATSFSCRTVVYKGMFVGPQLGQFYEDLKNSVATSRFAIVHQRYSTNTFPSWILAQPFHTIAHNGEINTLRGNLNRMKSREPLIASPLFGEDIKKLFPITDPSFSDSANFDGVLELLVQGGRSIEHSVMMMMPEAFGAAYHVSQDRRAFYEYHATIMEPWDGPAAIVFSDGKTVGASLDRNGLRPARWTLTKDGRFVLASESGVLDFAPEEILRHGRLAPGKMLTIDFSKKRVRQDNEIKSQVSRAKPYRLWLDEQKIELKELFQVPRVWQADPAQVATLHRVFGYTHEELEKVIAPMVLEGKEPLSSMGNDLGLTLFDKKPTLLFDYFKQFFAQVTNPPIDPYREKLVMSLMTFVGRERNLLRETPKHCNQLKLQHPILSNNDMVKIKKMSEPQFKTGVISTLYTKDKGVESALQRITQQAVTLIQEKHQYLVLSDKDVDKDHIPIPVLIVVSAVHQALVEAQVRQHGALFVETAEARTVMHMALLLGYGVSAINPYLVFKSLQGLKDSGNIPKSLSLEKAAENYIQACNLGVLKIMSKMGVSTVRSYRGSALFEAVGLHQQLIADFFPGTTSSVGGLTLEQVMHSYEERHAHGFAQSRAATNTIQPLESGGDIHYRTKSKQHLMTPKAVVYMQQAARSGDYTDYKKFSAEIMRGASLEQGADNPITLRDLFRFKQPNQSEGPIPLHEVEPATEIVKRFVSSAMSLGSISREAHETIAIAMNRLGAMSNSGEGGENVERYNPLANGDSLNSKVKQVASGRFGVTSNYLSQAEELQIKIAQGAKPGEGGQIPGHKVNEFVASIRNATPGTMLISPPPHHDIYSIEDLAQLMYDLQCANPKARISVKLVSKAGIGTIAAGVAKGKAQMILVSGGDGGTGASPISSIKHTGMPWEIGLAETHQTLVLNGLRKRVRLQADGQMRTGRDIVIATLLGAEEYGFGTASLITLGCVMMRKCHKNTCPVGVATQDPELRKRFMGKPEHLINYMTFVAEETREIMAYLGFRTIDEMVGRSDLLEVDQAISLVSERGVDLSKLLYIPEHTPREEQYCTAPNVQPLESHLDKTLIAKCMSTLKNPTHPSVLKQVIKNTDRSVGATLSYEISKRYGAKGLPDAAITVQLTGDGGQSLGAFLAKGITFQLAGTANDYVGKGLSGGRIIVAPPEGTTFRSQNNSIVGNVGLFGATSGELFISGMAGERFAVRNSGATAVVEGVGDHGCEYMTGGTVVVLGKTGINFAAGMSGGVAYVLDEDQLFDTKCNLEMVQVEPLTQEKERKVLQNLIQQHQQFTGSTYAQRILDDWTELAPSFVKVVPQRRR